METICCNKTRNYNNLYAFVALCCCIILTTGCNRDKESDGLTGTYVNQSYLTDIADSVAGLVPVYCYELHFLSPDRVAVLYGFEEDTLSYHHEGNLYVLEKALQDKDMKFKINTDKTITLVDSGWNNQLRNSVFKQSITTTGEKWDFASYLNQQMIAGKYTLTETTGPATEVTFSADGSVAGLGDFERYEICYSGDCVGETYPIANNITFSGRQGKSTTYAFFKKDNSLELRHIEAAVPDIKGERAIAAIAYRLNQL